MGQDLGSSAYVRMGPSVKYYYVLTMNSCGPIILAAVTKQNAHMVMRDVSALTLLMNPSWPTAAQKQLDASTRMGPFHTI